jgi:hypothetical protein
MLTQEKGRSVNETADLSCELSAKTQFNKKKDSNEFKSEEGRYLNSPTGLPGGDRTPDPQLRRLLLYPTELRAEIERLN